MVGGVLRLLRKLKGQIDDVVAVVSRVHPERLIGAAYQHASGDHERERDRDLGGDKEVAQPAAHRRRAAAADRGEERGAGAFDGRRQAEQDAGEH